MALESYLQDDLAADRASEVANLHTQDNALRILALKDSKLKIIKDKGPKGRIERRHCSYMDNWIYSIPRMHTRRRKMALQMLPI